MTREKIQTRCDDDVVEGLEDYVEENDISKSEAVRRLLRGGLVREGYKEPNPSVKGVLVGKLRSLLK